MTFRVMSLLGGLAMVLQSFLSFFTKILTLSPLRALISVYCFVFGLITIVLESSVYDSKYLKGVRDMVNVNCKILTYTWGRGLLYMFEGSIMFSMYTFGDMLVGGFMFFVGFTSVTVGMHTARKLTELKRSLGSSEVVKSKFDEMDKDNSGTLDSKELAVLCKELGSELDHNELVAALSTMDKDGDGKITYEEFYGWWTGWKHDKGAVLQV